MRARAARDIVATIANASFDEVEQLVRQYRDDPRRQVRRAVEVALRRHEKERAERARVLGMYALQGELGGHGTVLGVDEVGRGAVAGPLAVAAVALPVAPTIWGLNDSKRLSPSRREELAAQIAEVAPAIGLYFVDAAAIDAVGMSLALRRAMAGAIDDAGVDPDAVLIDGNPVHVHPKEICVIKGDATVACIAAASIVAKVARDRLMVSLDKEYPHYHWASCKGYASAEHIEAIRAFGLCELHRATFCGHFLETPSLF